MIAFTRSVPATEAFPVETLAECAASALTKYSSQILQLAAEMTDLGTWARPEGGFFVGVTLNKDVKAETLITKGLEAGIQLTNGRDFFADGRGDTFVRLPFCTLTTEEIDAGVRTLARVVRSL